MQIIIPGHRGADGIGKFIGAEMDGEPVMILLLKPATSETGEPWYCEPRLNRLAQINGGRRHGEQTMLEMLGDGSLLEQWIVPDEEIFGPPDRYLAQFGS